MASVREAQVLIDEFERTKVFKFIKEYRSDVYKKIATAHKTRERKLEEKFYFLEKHKRGGKLTKANKCEDHSASPTWAENIIEQVEGLLLELASVKKEKIANLRIALYDEMYALLAI